MNVAQASNDRYINMKLQRKVHTLYNKQIPVIRLREGNLVKLISECSPKAII